MRHVAYSKADEIAAAELAVYCQVEHGQIAGCMRVLKVNSDSPDVLRLRGGFWPTSLSLFHASRLPVSSMTDSLVVDRESDCLVGTGRLL